MMLRFIQSALLLCVVSGCSSKFDYGPTGRITGRLTLDGQALPPRHAVSFMEMQAGYLAFGLTDENGNFEVNSWHNGDMPIGRYKVMIAAPSPESAPDPNSLTPEERFDHPELADPVPVVTFPARYLATTTSGLEFDVKEGPNKFEIDLKSE